MVFRTYAPGNVAQRLMLQRAHGIGSRPSAGLPGTRSTAATATCGCALERVDAPYRPCWPSNAMRNCAGIDWKRVPAHSLRADRYWRPFKFDEMWTSWSDAALGDRVPKGRGSTIEPLPWKYDAALAVEPGKGYWLLARWQSGTSPRRTGLLRLMNVARAWNFHPAGTAQVGRWLDRSGP